MEERSMEERTVKFVSNESNKLALHVIPGHFATSNSHINYYVDVTTIKTRANVAHEAARVFQGRLPKDKFIDTIVCLDGTEVIGAYLSEELEKAGVISKNRHGTMYVISPEINNINQIIFRDNNKGAINGKNVILLLATTTTGQTIRRAIECVQYYGGTVVGVAAIFGTFREVDGMKVETLFDTEDVINYQAYTPQNCPFCKKGIRIEAMVNGFGYSKL